MISGNTLSGKDAATHGALRFLLSLPILYKILIVNAAIILIWGIAGTWLAALFARGQTDRLQDNLEFFVALMAGGVLLSLLTNIVAVKMALRPLASMEAVVHEVRKGKLHARATTGLLSDPTFNRLADTLNAMLDRLESYTAAIEAEKTRSQLLAAEVIKAQERERQRVARELHDETSQALATLIINLEMLEALVGPEQQSLSKGLSEMKTLTTQMLESIRQLAYDLRPTMLDDLGLIPAVRWCMKSHLEKSGIESHLESAGLDQRLDPELETALYRIVQESITNITKYARARHVTITLTADETAVKATIEDDGIGFDVERVLSSAPKDRGLGLFGMQERALVLHGRIDINSVPNMGTKIQATIPLEVELAIR